MKILYTILLSFLAVSIYAQPTLTSAWVPHIGLQTRIYGYDGTNGLSEGSAGANQTWDLTAYDTTGSQVVHCIAPSSAPGGSNYPNATDCSEGLSTQGNNSYTFDQLIGNTYQLIGVTEPNNSSYTTTYTRPQVIYHFPETYNSNFLDTAVLTGSYQGASPGTVTGVTYEVDTVDGYGTLITAAGTFTNVLRVKLLQTIMDTETVSGQSAPLYYYYETYNWVSPSIPGLTLASISHLDNMGFYQDAGYYAQVITTGIDELSASGISSLSIMPQPAAEKATLMINNEKAATNADIEIHDLTGRLVSSATKTLTSGKNSIDMDVSALSDGMYTVSIVVNGNADTRKLIVRH